MEISVWGCVLGMLLLAVPVVILNAQGLLPRRLWLCVLRMALFLAVPGALAWLLVAVDSPWLNVVSALLYVAATTVVMLFRHRLPLPRLFLPVAAGMVAAVAVVCAWLLLVLSVPSPFSTSRLLPVVALVAGGVAELEGRALACYYAGLLHHGQLYQYLVGNGATRTEAIRYLVRRTLQKVAVSGASRLSLIVVATTPLVAWAFMLCGASVFTAFAFQAVLLAATFSASVLSVYVALLLAQRFLLDSTEQLRQP